MNDKVSDFRISAVIPAYNAEKYIGQTLQSVVDQIHPAHEIIVVNDGSTDATVETVLAMKLPNLKVIIIENSGTAIARNTGAAQCHSDFIAFLDADDLWQECALAASVAGFSSQASAQVSFGHAIQFIEPGTNPGLNLSTEKFLAQAGSTTVIRREAFEQMGGFSAEADPNEPEVVQFLIKLQHLGYQQIHLPEVVVRRRIHESNRGHKAITRQLYMQALKSALDLKRSNK